MLKASATRLEIPRGARHAKRRSTPYWLAPGARRSTRRAASRTTCPHICDPIFSLSSRVTKLSVSKPCAFVSYYCVTASLSGRLCVVLAYALLCSHARRRPCFSIPDLLSVVLSFAFNTVYSVPSLLGVASTIRSSRASAGCTKSMLGLLLPAVHRLLTSSGCRPPRLTSAFANSHLGL